MFKCIFRRLRGRLYQKHCPRLPTGVLSIGRGNQFGTAITGHLDVIYYSYAILNSQQPPDGHSRSQVNSHLTFSSCLGCKGNFHMPSRRFSHLSSTQRHKKVSRSIHDTYWPKVTHAGNNVCDARFTSHLLLECRAYEARIMCTTYAWDVRGMLLRQHVTHACHAPGMRTSLLTRLSRVWRPFIADAAYFYRVGSAWDHGLLLVSTVSWKSQNCQSVARN
jgi:hypothetical protein